MLIDFRIEPEGRAVITEGLQRTTVLRDLKTALDDDEADSVELDFSKLVDVEIRAAAGLFFGLCRTVDVARFPKTLQFCFTLLENLNAEFERRRAVIHEN
jgi:hypothetical protein